MYIQSKPKLIDRLTRDRWIEAGHLDMESRALIAAKELLATWEPAPLSEEACARVRAVLNAAERDYGVPESLEETKKEKATGNIVFSFFAYWGILLFPPLPLPSPVSSTSAHLRILPSSSHGLGLNKPLIPQYFTRPISVTCRSFFFR